MNILIDFPDNEVIEDASNLDLQFDKQGTKGPQYRFGLSTEV